MGAASSLHAAGRRLPLAAMLLASSLGLGPGEARGELDYGPYKAYQGGFYKRLGAECLERAGAAAQCVQLLETSLAFDPTEPTVYLVLGQFYGEAGALDKARGAFARALELAPDFLPARLGLAEVYIAEGQHDRAKALYQSWADAHPGDAMATYQLASLEASRLEEEAALTLLRQAIREGFDAPAGLRQDPRWRGVLGAPALNALLAELDAQGDGR